MAHAMSKIEQSSSSSLTAVQRAEMMACIHTAVEELRGDILPSKNSQRNNTHKTQTSVSNLSPTAAPFVAVTTTPYVDLAKAKNWQVSEVGYFLPDPTREDQVRTVQNSLYFGNVLAFIIHIQALSAFMNENIIRLNLWSCLRGEALEWFMSELSQAEREKLRSSSLEEGWLTKLRNRFKPRPSTALKLLKKSKYNWSDVRSQHSLVMWAHNMLRLARASNEYPETWQRLHAVWDQIEIPIRGNVSEPNQETTIASFMEELDGWYNLWR